MRVVEDEAEADPRYHRANGGNGDWNKNTTQAREGADYGAERRASQAGLKQANHGRSPEGMLESAWRHWCGESRSGGWPPFPISR
jgi:hypothetical protein